MFNKNFYPTPKEVIRKMIGSIDFRNKKVLEPSAGKGDILNFISDKISGYYGYNKNINLFCIELNKDLQQILIGNSYNLISEDFLTYQQDQIFDFIIMNPPFDNGAKHLLKAWEVSEGAEIVCLLNSDTLDNAYSKERQLLKNIIEENGTVEKLGNVFSQSERKTGVNVSLVRLKDKDYKSQFIFNMKDEQKVNFEDMKSKNEVAIKNLYLNLEIKYNKVKELLIKKIKLDSEIQHYGQDLMNYGNIRDIEEKCNRSFGEDYFNSFMDIFKKQAWEVVFSNTGIAKYATEKVKKDLRKKMDKQGSMAFTEENIYSLADDLFQNYNNIMQSCIEESFDLMTKYYKENRVHIEGWKTNEQWQVNRKIILPNMRASYSFTGYNLGHEAKNELRDIEKGLCFLTGKNFNRIKSIVDQAERDNIFGQWYESEFFKFKLFKKGTMHLYFIDEYIWKQFNIQSCKFKKWLKN